MFYSTLLKFVLWPVLYYYTSQFYSGICGVVLFYYVVILLRSVSSTWLNLSWFHSNIFSLFYSSHMLICLGLLCSSLVCYIPLCSLLHSFIAN